MTRKALIIANPGEEGKQGYCAGVLKDVQNYTRFMRSPIGGLWQADEINILHQPSRPTTIAAVNSLATVDYSVIVFSGHGWHSSTNNSTMVELRPDTDLDSNELRRGAGKHTLILDCCRVVALETITLAEELRAMEKRASVINPAECRRFFEKKLSDCPSGLVVLFACSVNETAGDSASQGGYYSYSVISAADTWGRETRVDTEKSYRCLSVVAAHEVAAPRVTRLSGGRQTPTTEKPRSGEYFPFAIIA